MTGSRLRCTGCGFEIEPDEPFPFRCPRAGSGGDVDHVLARILDPEGLTFPSGADTQPFVRYRALLHSYQWALAHGIGDTEWCDLVATLDDAVAAVAGQGLRVSVPERAASLSDDLGFDSAGGVWIKDETGQPGGTHKIRHLFGVAIHLLAVEQATPAPPVGPLAISSCGNAALAAAVVARAMERDLLVFVPEWADPAIIDALDALGARVVRCVRDETELGDPCVVEFRTAVEDGAVPFGCQGTDNALTLDGGRTVAWEIVTAGVPFDQCYVQVGGGALASSLAQGLEEAAALGALARLPRLVAVQTEGGAPLARAYDRVSARVARRGTTRALAHAARHRSQYMWPWSPPPRSAATGILDDEVYDWWALVAAMLRTGGHPVVAPERLVAEAGRRAGGAADPTGAAGLAGLLTEGANPHARAVVLFTGRSRPIA